MKGVNPEDFESKTILIAILQDWGLLYMNKGDKVQD